MTIGKIPAKVTASEIDKIINAGGSQSNESKIKPKTKTLEDVRITISIPSDLAAAIDRVRLPTKTSRRTWLLQIAYDKLKQDGEL